MENIKHCIELAQLLEHKEEARRATDELKNMDKAIVAAKVLLIAITKGELQIFPADDKTPEYIQLLENATKKSRIF